MRMSGSSHLSDNLGLLAHETGLLLASAGSLDDESIRAASLCQGWSRAHVLTHLARNADALGNLVSWAVTGTPKAMYASEDARDGEIESGSTRSAPEIVADLEEATARFASAAAGLTGSPEDVKVEMRAGRTVRGGQLPTLRLLEVVFHHVDLDAGYTFADADPGFVSRAISNAVDRFRTRGGPLPSLTLHGDDDKSWSLGEGAQDVYGTNAALLLWLARGLDSGVSSKTALPTMPAWG
jgi:maleylpyruvate isomerase